MRPTAQRRLREAPRRALETVGAIALASVVVLPLADLGLSRLFWTGLPQSKSIVDNSLVVLAFVAAALASLDRRHLSLTGPVAAATGIRAALHACSQAAATTVQTGLFWASLSLVFNGFDASDAIWGIPVRIFAAAMPLGFLLMAAFTAYRSRRPALTALGFALGSLLAVSCVRNLATYALGAAPAALEILAVAVEAATRFAILPLGALFALGALFGAPLFTALGGIAVTLYVASGAYVELAPSEAYSLLRSSSIAALPLFGLAGFLLAESAAGTRLVAVFRELFGWIRGGEAIVAVLACAFFSTFTGVNGVTIIALGGLLVALLSGSGAYREDRARGLVTASGDIGLLLPPSAVVIVYGVNAQFIYGEGSAFDVATLFKGAFLPGLLLVVAMCVAGVIASPPRRPDPARRAGPDLRAVAAALRTALLELLVPAIAVLMYFTGFAGLTEIGAFCVLYIVVVEVLVKRSLDPASLFEAIRKYLPIVGGTLIIIATARGLAFYIIDANLPEAFAAWIASWVSSRIVFLLALNVFLLVVGCLMDIYSAILVVAPLVIPLGAAFGVHPVHFGVIFIMNLCLGFLTPTVGINVFLASYAFKQPIARIVKDFWPFVLVMLGVLLVITYVPWLSTVLIGN